MLSASEVGDISTSSDRSESPVPEGAGGPPFDGQQARLLSILASRTGEPVTYDELRRAGFEFPAGLVSEIELAGVEIERCRAAGSDGRPVAAVRLPHSVRGIPGGPDTDAGTSAAKSASSHPPRPKSAPSRPQPREPTLHTPAGSAADWSAVHVYRSSIRGALTARWARQTPLRGR